LSPEPRTGRPVRLATLAMVILATLAIELAISEPGRPALNVLASAAGLLLAPMLAAAWWLGRTKRDSPVGAGPRRSVQAEGLAEFAAIAFLLVLPFAGQPILAAWSGRGVPLEIVLMASLRNLGLGLAALAHRPACARLAALVSLFLALVASSIGDGMPAVVAVAIYSVAGTTWLMLAYWEGLSPSMGRGRRAGPPLLAVAAWASVVAVLGVAAVAVGPTRAASVLAELVASSGGTGENDPEARGGVNDGDNEVAASKDPRSIGFTESEVYLESERPSLYDSFSEQYGEPIKPKGPQQRMVALGPQDTETKDRPTENLHAGRTFPTVRQRPTRRGGPGAERRAKALVYVKGETPLHLGLAAYDRFDGVTWQEEPHCGQPCPLELIPGEGAWLRLDLPSTRPLAGPVRHQIKIGMLDSSPLPVPSHVTRLRVGSVNRPEFFGWAQAGLLKMVERTVPAGTVIDTESRAIDPRRLRSIQFEEPSRAASGRYLGVPGTLDPGVPALVRSWAGAIPRGWSQVEAVVAGVRGHCVHDHLATAPEGCRDVVGHFLMRSRSGPDYLFASSTAVALRLLGYPSRVMGGYYASPARHDARSRHTPVTAEDAHFWVEVLLPGGIWAAVEPTPGYELLGPALSLGGLISEALGRAWSSLRANAPAILAGLVAAGLLIGFRRQVFDHFATLSWRLSACGPSRDRAIRTLRLVESRSGWAGLARPPGRTPSRWYRSIAPDAPHDLRAGLARLVAMADWASFAPEDATRVPPWSDLDVRSTCSRAVRDWTLGRFRSHHRPPTPR